MTPDDETPSGHFKAAEFVPDSTPLKLKDLALWKRWKESTSDSGTILYVEGPCPNCRWVGTFFLPPLTPLPAGVPSGKDEVFANPDDPAISDTMIGCRCRCGYGHANDKATDCGRRWSVPWELVND